MVTVEKKKVIIKSKYKRSDGQKVREIETVLIDYGESQVDNVVISAAVVMFQLKKEDRHQVMLMTEDEPFRNCQKKVRCEPRMAFFCGVYDGHDGDGASEYCSKGMVPHILSELTRDSRDRGSQRWSISGPDRANAPLALAFETQEHKDPHYSDMEIPYIAAFQKAQQRFGKKMDPPSFEEVEKTSVMKVAPPTNPNPMKWMGTSSQPPRSGTTACTMSVFVEIGEELPIVVAANTGDSRLITDDGTGSHKYRQVTTDHRPDNPAEKRRLTEAVARGETTLHRSSEHKDVRIFPGGLAVSRTIGDLQSSKSVICTPEVIKVPLQTSPGPGQERTQRFVLASDGLWDVTENDEVGKAAARKVMPKIRRSQSGDSLNSNNPTDASAVPELKRSKSGDSIDNSKTTGASTAANKIPSRKKNSTPKEAAAKIMQLCLQRGGDRDDITICVVDVSYR